MPPASPTARTSRRTRAPCSPSMQREAGAKGITCQKLGEAEVMADGGLDDILISYNLLGEEKMGRLGALLRPRHDHGRRRQPDHRRRPAARGRDRRARRCGVVMECDTGRKRAGVETPGEAIALARASPGQPGPALRRASCSIRPRIGWRRRRLPRRGAWRASARWARAAHRLDRRHAEPRQSRPLKGATEHRAGTSIFNDRMMMRVRRGEAGGLRAQRLRHGGEPRRRPSGASSIPAPRR